jgi:hypothetical protein
MKCQICGNNEHEYQVCPNGDWYWEYFCCRDCLKIQAEGEDHITRDIKTANGASFEVCDTQGNPKQR